MHAREVSACLSVAAGAELAAQEYQALTAQINRSAQEEHGPGGVFQIMPGSYKEISAIDVEVTVSSNVGSKGVLDGVLKKGPSDSSDSVVAFVVIQDRDDQFRLLPAEGPGEVQRWKVRRTATDPSYFDARQEAAAIHWCNSQILEVRRVGAAYITRLLHMGKLQDARMILRQVRPQHVGLYKVTDFDHLDILRKLEGCTTDARKLLEKYVPGISSLVEEVCDPLGAHLQPPGARVASCAVLAQV
jgi:hypothetical protein